MLTKQETKGLARWKPLFILPLAVVLVLAFAESKTVIQPSPGVGPDRPGDRRQAAALPSS